MVAAADDRPQSPAAREAIKEYDAALKKLDDEYQKKVTALRDDYLKKLETAREESIAKKDLDEAQRILAELKAWAEEPPATVNLQIVAAWWGWYDAWKDVTPMVKRLARNGELRLKRSGEASVGMPDIAFGQHKSLFVVYRYKGVLRVAHGGDDKPIVIPGPR